MRGAAPCAGKAQRSGGACTGVCEYISSRDSIRERRARPGAARRGTAQGRKRTARWTRRVRAAAALAQSPTARRFVTEVMCSGAEPAGRSPVRRRELAGRRRGGRRRWPGGSVRPPVFGVGWGWGLSARVSGVVKKSPRSVPGGGKRAYLAEGVSDSFEILQIESHESSDGRNVSRHVSEVGISGTVGRKPYFFLPDLLPDALVVP